MLKKQKQKNSKMKPAEWPIKSRYRSIKIRKEREQYVNEKVRKYIKIVRRGLKSEVLKGDEGLNELWNVLQECANLIKIDFSLKHVCIFGHNRIRRELLPKLYIVAADNDFSKKFNCRNLRYDLDKVPRSSKKILSEKKIVISNKEPLLLDGIEGIELDSNKDFIRIFAAPSSSDIRIVTWIVYDNNLWNPLINKSDIESAAVLEIGIRPFYSFILSTLACILANTAKNYMQNMIMGFRHETTQYSLGLNLLRDIYLSDMHKFKKLSDQEMILLHRDVEGYLRQLSLLFEQAKILTSKFPDPEKVIISNLNELLLKWNHTYRLDATVKKIHLVINHQPINNESSHLHADPLLLDILLQHIIGNAIKYSYRGTRIQIDCSKLNEKSNGFILLSFKNYGCRMEKGYRPFQLGHRGNNVRHIKGSGVGLFLARQITSAHDGLIKQDVKRISDFNVPLIEQYLNNKTSLINRALLKPLHDSFLELKQSGQYKDIVAHNNESEKYYKATTHELLKSINNPTYEVTLNVRLLCQGGQKDENIIA